MPEDFFIKLNFLKIFLQYLNLKVLELKFNDNGNWEVMCSDNFCKPGANYDVYLDVSFNGSEISYVSLGCSEYYRKTGRNEIRNESNKLFDKSFYMHKVFGLENFYQMSCNNKIIGYYFKNNNGEYSRIKDLTKITVSFSDGDCQNTQNTQDTQNTQNAQDKTL